MKKISKTVIITIIVLLVNVTILLYSTSKLPNPPSEDFKEIMDKLFTTEEVTIYINDTEDITEEFKTVFEKSYKDKDYQLLYDTFSKNELSATWMVEE